MWSVVVLQCICSSYFCHLSFHIGSSCVPGTWVHQESDQGPQQRLTAFPHIMNELEEPQVERQLLLRDPPVRAQPRPQQGPKAFDRVDMDLMEAIPIVITGILPSGMTHRLMRVSP